MSNVTNYVNIMRKQGAAQASINPNSEMSMLKRELIEHYKGNPLKAWALINGIESNSFVNVSAEQRLHYEAAVIAVRGYNNTTTKPRMDFTPPNQVNELDTLKKAGWEELNKPKESMLLHEKI